MYAVDMLPERLENLTVVVRGDLFSDTGYARATRALVDVARPLVGRIFGVSLHAHHARRANEINFPVVEQDALDELARLHDVIVLNVCTPDAFRRTHGAWNIGYFFWETERLPRTATWLPPMRLMDRLWAPSTWQRDFLAKTTGRDDIVVVPWPQHRSDLAAASDESLAGRRAHRPMSLPQLRNYELRARPPGQSELEKDAEERAYRAGVVERFDFGASPLLSEMLQDDGETFLCIQTDAPRKGLAALLTGWMAFRKRPSGRSARLVIKASSIDVAIDEFRLHFHLSLAVLRAAARAGVEYPNVFFVYDRLSNAQMDNLILRSDAYLTATYGEGFGGPVAEALMLGKPVIAPSHTSLQDLLPAGYPLTISSEKHPLALWTNIPVYSPSSAWHLPDDESIADCLDRFCRMSAAERSELASYAQDALLARAGRTPVARILQSEFEAAASARSLRRATRQGS